MKNKNLSANLSAQIAEWLTNRGIFHAVFTFGKIQNGNCETLCETKTPVCFAIIQGQCVFVEVKKIGEKLTAEQRFTHDELSRHGAIVLVCDLFDEFIVKFSAIRAAVNEREKELELYD